MEQKIIEAGDADYLGEIPGFDDLPSACRFNKVLTGSGGTTVALRNEVPYVICMPYISLIINKLEYCNEKGIDVLPVYGGMADIEDIQSFSGKKIMVTYDSLKKVVEALGGQTRHYKILVDEYHLLINSGSFRYDAVNEVLRLYKEFDDFVFMTATPTKEAYLPGVLKSIPEVSVRWNNIRPVTLDYSIIEGKYLYPAVATIANKFVTEETNGNGYFFLNSVQSIIDTVKYLKKLDVSHDDIRIVCANNKGNEAELQNELGVSYEISTVSDIPKKVNFMTSTVFEGSDIFDTEGITYIVSDGKKPHTKYDIMTTIPQIIGRIRDTQYKHWAKVIFSPSEYFSHTTEEEFAQFVHHNLDRARRIVSDFNNNGPETRELMLKGAKSDSYLVINGSTLEVNETSWCAELQHFNALHTTYYVKRDQQGKPIQDEGSKEREINNVPYIFNSIPAKSVMPDKLEGAMLGVDKKCFKDLVETYNGYSPYSILSKLDYRKIKFIETHYPLIPEAFSILGYDKIVALGCHKTKIEAEVLKTKILSNPAKMRRLLDSHKYAVGRKIPYNTIKADLQKAFDLLGIDRTATAKNLEVVFGVKPCKVSVDGERVNGYKILGTL